MMSSTALSSTVSSIPDVPGTLNVYSHSDDWRALALANFGVFPYELDGVVCVSIEGFIQGIKFAPDDPVRVQAFQSHGWSAKHLGKGAGREWVWWNGQRLAYGSTEHHALIARAIRSKAAQNGGVRLALRACAGLVFRHDIGEPIPPTTSLPADVYCRILTELRDELLRTGSVADAR